MCAGDGTERGDECNQSAAGCERVREQRNSGVSACEAFAHDAGPDDGDEQKHGAQCFGGEAAGKVAPCHGLAAFSACG